MNIDELRSAQSKERQKSDLQQLRDSFYGDVAEYVSDLEAERDRAADRADDPFGSPEVQQLTNDIETAKDTAEAIYERRLGKIVKKASLVSAEMANQDDVNGLTTEEQTLFADLVDRIEENKAHMLDVIAGEAEAGVPNVDTSASTADASASAGTTTDEASTADARDAESTPHPEDGLGGDAPGGDATPTESDGSTAGERDADLQRSEAAAVADEEPGDADDRTGSGDADASVSAADLMGGDAPDDEAESSSDAAGAAETSTDAADATETSTDATGTPAGEAGATGDAGASADSSTAGGAGATDGAGTTDDAGATEDADRVTLRVTRDVGEIFAVDEREYRLDAEDVVTLPEENADVLVSQDAAERLD